MAKSYALDDYLEAIYILESEGVLVIGARLAEIVSVRAPSVTEALHRLEKRGDVSLNEHHAICFTPQGRERAEAIVRRHRLAERWLTDILGLDWGQADTEAHKLQHAFSLEVADRLSQVMDNPKTCPHGNPIPGNCSSSVAHGVRLDAVVPGGRVVVERVREDAEVDEKLLRYLWRNGITPGVRLTMVEAIPAAGTVTVLRNGEKMDLGIVAASKIQVKPVEEG